MLDREGYNECTEENRDCVVEQKGKGEWEWKNQTRQGLVYID